MDRFFIVSSETSSYAATSEQAAHEAGAKPWNWKTLANAIHKLELGDELSVDHDISVFRISGKDIDYDGQSPTLRARPSPEAMEMPGMRGIRHLP